MHCSFLLLRTVDELYAAICEGQALNPPADEDGDDEDYSGEGHGMRFIREGFFYISWALMSSFQPGSRPRTQARWVWAGRTARMTTMTVSWSAA